MIICKAVDINRDSLEYVWTANGGKFIGHISGSTSSWKAPEDSGKYIIKVVVSDGQISKEKELVITVKTPAPNKPPKSEPVKTSAATTAPEKPVSASKPVPEPVGKAPVADFTASLTEVKVGEGIQFTDKSSESPTAWLWDFGDESSGIEQNPMIKYKATGSYTVKLTVTNSFGSDTKTITNYISVKEAVAKNETGTFTDSRDGKIYKTVKIGSQCWMAENLAYLPAVSPPAEGSDTVPHYYVSGYSGTDIIAAKATENYSIYGVLYNWPAVMAGSASSNANPSGIKGICPNGWHLPSDAEWTILSDYLENSGNGYQGSGNDIAKSMAAKNNWKSDTTAGTPGNDLASNNSSGFFALPGGSRTHYGTFWFVGFSGGWWSSSEDYSSGAWFRYLNNSYTCVGRSVYDGKHSGFSVRCVRDL